MLGTLGMDNHAHERYTGLLAVMFSEGRRVRQCCPMFNEWQKKDIILFVAGSFPTFFDPTLFDQKMSVFLFKNDDNLTMVIIYFSCVLLKSDLFLFVLWATFNVIYFPQHRTYRHYCLLWLVDHITYVKRNL